MEDKLPDTVRSSGTFRAFRDAANHILFELQYHKGPFADKLRDRASELIAEFDGWLGHPPTPNTRADTIQALMNLREQVSSYLSGER